MSFHIMMLATIAVTRHPLEMKTRLDDITGLKKTGKHGLLLKIYAELMTHSIITLSERHC